MSCGCGRSIDSPKIKEHLYIVWCPSLYHFQKLNYCICVISVKKDEKKKKKSSKKKKTQKAKKANDSEAKTDISPEPFDKDFPSEIPRPHMDDDDDMIVMEGSFDSTPKDTTQIKIDNDEKVELWYLK